MKPARSRLIAHRQRRQLQPGDPALGARLQRGQIGSGERQAHDLIEKGRGFVGGEAQIVARAVRSRPAARRRASGRGGSARVRITRCSCGRQIVEQPGQGRVNGRRGDHVIVLEHQGDVAPRRRRRGALKAFSTLVRMALNRRRLRRLQQASAVVPTPGASVSRAART